jgi:hypothetical protein
MTRLYCHRFRSNQVRRREETAIMLKVGGREDGSMHRLAILFSLLILLAPAAALGAEPQWLTLPPTPTLPKPAQSGTAAVNGIKLWYATFGQGEPVILLHGGLANANYWGHQVRALQPRYRVIVMDSRGHGRSTRDERPYGYDLMAADVIGLMDFLKIPKAAIVGWSDGAILGLDIAMQHPDTIARRRGPELWMHGAVRINQRLLLEGSFEWTIECLELPQEQTSPSAALMSQNDPKRTLWPLLSQQ